MSMLLSHFDPASPSRPVSSIDPVLLVLFTASLEADGGRVRFTGSAEGNSLAVLFTLKMMLVDNDFILYRLLRALVACPQTSSGSLCPHPSGQTPSNATGLLQYKALAVYFLLALLCFH